MDSTALEKMSENQMLARIGAAKFPQELTPSEKKLLAMVAITYGFDPLMGEITIYQGRPYVSIDGRYRKAQETGQLCGVKTRPATREEREAWQIPIDDYFYHAEVNVKGGGFNYFEGWGRVRKEETKPGSKNDPNSTYKPIQFNPQRMAEKRAEAMALRKAFHINLPSLETRGTEDEEAPVNLETGEVIDTTISKPDPAKAEKDIANLFDDGPSQPPATSGQPEQPAAVPRSASNQAVEPVKGEKASPAKPKAPGQPLPTTKQALLNWIYSHRPKETTDQFAQMVGYDTSAEIPDDPAIIKQAYETIKTLKEWKD